MKIISELIKLLQSLRYYVIADPRDDSVTFSKGLFMHMRKRAEKDANARVFMFRIPEHTTFGFTINPALEKETILCPVQYNDRFKCIGFQALCPSVGLMLYEFGLPSDAMTKLSVSVHRSPRGMVYYQFDKPNGKCLR